MKYAYYPGCSLESQLAKEFDLSAIAVCEALGIELEELHDWNCCGASSGHSTNMQLNHAIVGRNLALAERQGLDIAAACPACYVRLKHTRHAVMEDPELKANMIENIEMPFEGTSDVRHLLDIMVNDIGLEEVREKVVKPLTGLKLVSYYGCFLVRPPKVVAFDDPENPTSMDVLLESLGADVRDWTGKVDCCGGSLAISKRDIVIGLVGDIVQQAKDVGAEALVSACPLCDMNLDGRQSLKGETLPVFYFTELMGLAMGLPGTNKWWNKHIISPKKLLKAHGLI
ncbi:MAG: CoB--CoM heterodisulfide reductase iron-sulfur subunit B family protein [Dehalococcoidales bacterium]|nr:CoB--CoM heterodisulfide reductase iron-sulfur subunit B family protein [Dehalococcoidales bacterium]